MRDIVTSATEQQVDIKLFYVSTQRVTDVGDRTFPGQDLSWTFIFPDKTFPGKTFPGRLYALSRRLFSVQDVSRTICTNNFEYFGMLM